MFTVKMLVESLEDQSSINIYTDDMEAWIEVDNEGGDEYYLTDDNYSFESAEKAIKHVLNNLGGIESVTEFE